MKDDTRKRKRTEIEIVGMGKRTRIKKGGERRKIVRGGRGKNEKMAVRKMKVGKMERGKGTIKIETGIVNDIGKIGGTDAKVEVAVVVE